MVAWFVIAIGTLGLFAFIALNGVSTVDTLGESSARIQTVQRLDQLANGIMQRAAAVDTDGAVYLPAGVAGSNYSVPADLAALGRTPFGTFVTYCPFGGAGATATSNHTVTSSGTSYTVGVRALNGRSYVVSGRPAYANADDPNLLGFLVAPATRGAAPASCASVTYSGGRYFADGSIVRPLTRDVVADAGRRDAGAGAIYYVSTTGSGNGLTPASPMSLTTALDKYRSATSANITMLLGSGAYTIAGDSLNATADSRPRQSTLTIASYSGARDVSINLPVSSNVTPAQNLTLRSVAFGLNSRIRIGAGATLRLENAATGPIIASDGALVSARGASDIYAGPAGGAPLRATTSAKITANDTLTLHYAHTSNGIILDAGGSLHIQGATVYFAPATAGAKLASGISADSTSKVSIGLSYLNFQGPIAAGISAFGATNLDQVSLITAAGGDVAINAGGGAHIGLVSVSIGQGTPTTYGLVDNGIGAISGTATIRSLGACWAFPAANRSSMFAMSSPGTAGAFSSVTNDETPIALPAEERPTAEQVKAYQDTVFANELRSQLRRSNTSNFSCQIG